MGPWLRRLAEPPERIKSGCGRMSVWVKSGRIELVLPLPNPQIQSQKPDEGNDHMRPAIVEKFLWSVRLAVERPVFFDQAAKH